MYYENQEEHDEYMPSPMEGPMKKEFKLAMLEKKEKILQAKLEFIGKLKDIVRKTPDKRK